MDALTDIQVWMGNNIPARIRKAIGLPEFDSSEDVSVAAELQGVTIVFVAHVPSLVLSNPVYRQANWQAENSGWMREGECGLFGTNALSIHPHPEGDGILIVGGAV
jgi:hypothetical protein